MIDFKQWKERTVAVTSLNLDARNPRIPTETPLDTRGLVAELVAHENVYALAKDIAEMGYSPVELLVGTEENGKLVILEGNRRLASLKLLISPDLGPDAYVKRFRTLTSQIDLATIEKVKVLVAPTRDAAAPLILQKHTRQQIERWSPLMQARFYRSLKDSGISIEDLARQHNTSVADVSKFLRNDEMYKIACTLDLPAAIREKVHNPREFPAAVLERLLDTPKTRTFLGVEFDGQGSVVGSVQPDEFRKAYGKIITDIAETTVDTRTLNTVKHVEDYLARIKSAAPNKKKSGKFTAEDLLKADGGTSAAPAPAKPKRKLAAKLPSTMLAASIKCVLEDRRIREVHKELRTLKVENHPNACAVLTRILLELSVEYHLNKTKKMAAIVAAKGQGKGNQWSPSLRQMLSAILNDSNFTINAQARKKLNLLVAANNNDTLSLDALDGFVHNRYVAPTPRELHSIAAALAPVFEQLLGTEPQAPVKGA